MSIIFSDINEPQPAWGNVGKYPPESEIEHRKYGCDRCGKPTDIWDMQEIEVQWNPGGWDSHEICQSCYRSFERWAGKLKPSK